MKRYMLLALLALFLIVGSLLMLYINFSQEKNEINTWIVILCSILIGIFSLKRAYQLYQQDKTNNG